MYFGRQADDGFAVVGRVGADRADNEIPAAAVQLVGSVDFGVAGAELLGQAGAHLALGVDGVDQDVGEAVKNIAAGDDGDGRRQHGIVSPCVRRPVKAPGGSLAVIWD